MGPAVAGVEDRAGSQRMGDGLDLFGLESRVRLFPLPGVVLFPHAVLPLHIFEPRYRQMTADALADDRLIAIVRLLDPLECAGSGTPALEEVACLGRIIQHERLPDGRFLLLLLGLKRVRLVREVPTGKLYREAVVEVMEDEGPETCVEARRAELIGRFLDLATRQGVLEPELRHMLGSDVPLGPLTDLIAHALVGLPSEVKQVFLAEPRVDRRLDRLIATLRELAGGSPRVCWRYPPPVSRN